MNAKNKLYSMKKLKIPVEAMVGLVFLTVILLMILAKVLLF